MPSATYRLFRTAILRKSPVTCTYRGLYREVCPHIIGYKDGAEKVLTYQYAGESSTGLPRGGQWRCLTLALVRDARLKPGRWHTGDRHAVTQVCVDIVDLDVNLLGCD